MNANHLPIFDRTALDALLSDIGADRAGRVIGLFRGELEKAMQILGNAFAAADMHTIARTAHTIRNPAATLGFSRFAGELLATELAASYGNDDSAHPDTAQWVRLQADHAALLPELAALCAEFGTDIK
jgi:hypothetical protein